MSFGAYSANQRWASGMGAVGGGYPPAASVIGQGGMGVVGNPMAQGFVHNRARNAARERAQREQAPPQQAPVAPPVAPPEAPPVVAPPQDAAPDPDKWDWDKPVGTGPNQMNPGDDRGFRGIPGGIEPPRTPPIAPPPERGWRPSDNPDSAQSRFWDAMREREANGGKTRYEQDMARNPNPYSSPNPQRNPYQNSYAPSRGYTRSINL